MIMATRIKGIYRGIKRRITFSKKREMEIGSPTDVLHMSHIGMGDSSTGGPSWMSQFKTGPEFTTTSSGDSGSTPTPSPSSSSQDSCVSHDQQSPTSKLSSEISSTKTNTIPPPPRKRTNKNKAIPTSSSTSTLSSEISSTEKCTIQKKREKRNKGASASSTSPLSIEIPNTKTSTIPKKRKKRNSATSSPSLRSPKHSKTEDNPVEVE